MLATVLALGTGVVTGCGDPPPGRAAAVPDTSSPPAASTSPAGSPVPSTAPPASTSPAPGAGAPAPRPELARYLTTVPGALGVVVRDRMTGSAWQAGNVSFATWTASTIKLALATALLERQRAGTITLTDTDRANLRSMLVDSSNEATDALWEKYDGVAMIPSFQQRYGMPTLAVVPGYRPYWRHLQCSATDLAAAMTYALGSLAPADRTQLVGWLRAAAAAQPWGVWAAGAAHSPGHKPGWAFKPEGRPDHWVVHSVGFAGPGERYVVAVMYDLPAGRTAKAGAQVVSDVVALAFGRKPVPVRGP
jgi:hypothetical protein